MKLSSIVLAPAFTLALGSMISTVSIESHADRVEESASPFQGSILNPIADLGLQEKIDGAKACLANPKNSIDFCKNKYVMANAVFDNLSRSRVQNQMTIRSPKTAMLLSCRGSWFDGETAIGYEGFHMHSGDDLDNIDFDAIKAEAMKSSPGAGYSLIGLWCGGGLE